METLMSRIPAAELFLRSLPPDAAAVHVVYPASLDPRLVRRRLRHLAVSGEKRHRKLYYGAAALLPFTSLLGILPTPNVVFFWNIFRTYAHRQALKSSERLLKLATIPPAPQVVPAADADAELEPVEAEVAGSHVQENSTSGLPVNDKPPLVLMPSAKLEQLVGEHIASPMEPAVVEAICKAYDLDPALVARWRDQKR
eukprot:SM000054S18056  [mRNA]  locus=s54:82566:84857:+ [translate_table: standard]